MVCNLLINETVTKIEATGVPRWNLVLRDGLLHVTHLPGKVDVRQYYGVRLLLEESDVSIAEEVAPDEFFREGAVCTIIVNAFERNRAARERCLAHYGRRCSVCHMTFAEFYGPEASEIIHVHHLLELNKIGKEYEVDPIKDLRPVCPNCHAVVHSRKPAYNIEETTAFIRRAKEA